MLGPAEFAAAVRSGAAMSDADTVAYVQSEIDRLLGERVRRGDDEGLTVREPPARAFHPAASGYRVLIDIVEAR